MASFEEFDPTGWSETELRKLADHIYALLGMSEDLNVEEELLRHYSKTLMVYDYMVAEATSGKGPPNFAAVAGAITKVLGDIASLRTELRTAGDYQAMISAVITVLEDMDTSQAQEAVEKLRQQLGDRL